MPNYLTNNDEPRLDNVQVRRVPFATHDSQTWRLAPGNIGLATHHRSIQMQQSIRRKSAPKPSTSARTIAKSEADDRAIERWEDEGGRVSSRRDTAPCGPMMHSAPMNRAK